MDPVHMVLAVAGICFTGFLFLIGWILWLVQRVKERPTYEWFDKRMKGDLQPLTDAVYEMRDALLGDMTHEGLLSKERRRDERCVLHKLLRKDNVLFEQEPPK